MEDFTERGEELKSTARSAVMNLSNMGKGCIWRIAGNEKRKKRGKGKRGKGK